MDDRSSLIEAEEQQSSVAAPARLPHWLSRLRSYFVLDPLIFAYTFLLGSASFVASFADRGGTKQHAIARTWSRWILGTAMCPVRVIGGDQDKIVPPERVRRIADLTSAELLVIEGGGLLGGSRAHRTDWSLGFVLFPFFVRVSICIGG